MLSRSDDSPFRRDFERASADEEDAIVFLASITPRKDKMRIQQEIESNPGFEDKHHMFLGMNVRNALRAAGFFYLPGTMDSIWFSWLKEAVCLPEDKIVITDSIKNRIRKYEEQQLLENPPICPAMEEKQTLSIIRQLEDQYRIRMPEVKIEYSENVKNPFLLVPLSYDLDELPHNREERNRRLSSRGLKEDELNRIDSSKHTVFLARRHPKQGIGLYGSAWHELAHVAAYVMGIKDMVLSESFAYANEIRGLLQAVMVGQFSLEEAADAIEFLVKCAKCECLDTKLFSTLSRMGIKGISDDMKTPHHYLALEPTKRHNPELRFRDRRLDDLIVESDRTIDDILTTWKRTRLVDRLPAIILSGLVIAFLLILLIIGLLH